MTPSAQLTHFGVHTSDLDRMVDFYTRVMGFLISDQAPAAPARASCS
jgi:catechol 2,3-dioxygenase-like lactoylglutathione lyase family enzyme